MCWPDRAQGMTWSGRNEKAVLVCVRKWWWGESWERSREAGVAVTCTSLGFTLAVRRGVADVGRPAVTPSLYLFGWLRGVKWETFHSQVEFVSAWTDGCCGRSRSAVSTGPPTGGAPRSLWGLRLYYATSLAKSTCCSTLHSGLPFARGSGHHLPSRSCRSETTEAKRLWYSCYCCLLVAPDYNQE